MQKSTSSSVWKKYLGRAFGMLLILSGLNLASVYVHTRWDLTAEKRFTLSPATIRLLKHIHEPIRIQIYLSGKLPAGFRHLSESIRDLLNNFRNYAGSRIQYSFIDPSSFPDSVRSKLYDSLTAKGITPYNLQVQLSAAEGYSEKLIFPGAVLKTGNKERTIDLLESKIADNALASLNNAEALLEYKFANAIYHLQQTHPPLIGYMLGNDEPLDPRINDALTILAKNYLVDTIPLNHYPYIPQDFKAIVFIKPEKPFTTSEKLKIDQYLMHGGKILWFVDDLNASMDSLKDKNSFIAFDKNLHLEDLFFTYGVRINPDLIQDLQCDMIPLVVGHAGNQPQIQLVPWPYFPLLAPTDNSPIVKNMNPVLGHFVNSVDTVGTPGIRKTILLRSSAYSRIVGSPVKVSWNDVRIKPDPALFQHPFIPAAVLLEGRFRSMFMNRLDQQTLDSLNRVFPQPVADSSVPTAMIVVGDGDMAMNEISAREGPLPMGNNAYTHVQYANPQFFANCLEYLTDTSGIMQCRNKTFILRLMNTTRIDQQKNLWQALNFLVPIAFGILIGVAFQMFRKKSYFTGI
ncbi:gliding motility-associated ABC transporter substrate-binding protein GldG [Thermoflavifilum thermophilum]|uniref:Gliding-associated putative ABC transporter substrate-binding component GldG n=1 Tax=Thermoflavifilum thermophilum TaxID=1393122 RepID=A0A1I7NDW9_9BACT|nr:gliding motility-associated ABC transporter substrate-binding protein GldG [Thermoflavifilum thermophilum]SFV32877.1 gliding-associated putative ABC transporter substrate-binding component GldG [Thermoflavifilum thermophilum]